MYSLELSPRALAELEHMIASYPLPADTRARLRDRLALVERFPHSGQDLTGRWAGHQRVLGPFRWLASIYVVEGTQVKVVTIEDCRRSSAARTR